MGVNAGGAWGLFKAILDKLMKKGGTLMKIEGYSGICACCFEPIKIGEEMAIRKGGRLFHKKCIENYPDNYYVRLEHRNFARYGDKLLNRLKEG